MTLKVSLKKSPKRNLQEDLPPPPHFDDYGKIKRKDPEEIDERLRHYLTADSNVT